MPKSDDSKNTWIEFYSDGPDAISLEGWKIEYGDGKSFVIPKDGDNWESRKMIGAQGFRVLFGSQTGITFSKDGDIIRLYNKEGVLVDTQSYPGILGYNTSMGRSVDGAGTWTLCANPSTPEKPNNCLLPTAIPTLVPTSTPKPTPTLVPTNTPFPTPTAIPTPTDIPTPIPTPIPTQTIQLVQKILGVTDNQNGQDQSVLEKRRLLGIIGLALGGSWIFGIIFFQGYKRYKNRS